MKFLAANNDHERRLWCNGIDAEARVYKVAAPSKVENILISQAMEAKRSHSAVEELGLDIGQEMKKMRASMSSLKRSFGEFSKESLQLQRVSFPYSGAKRS